MEARKRKLSMKDFGPEKIILLAIAGVILLATNFSEWKAAKKDSEQENVQNFSETSENDAYIQALENKLVHILENVDGVGRVEVMLTLKSSGESILNKDDVQEEETEEETSDGTKKERQSRKKESETVLADEHGDAAPYVIKEMEPEIAGIVVSCEGADNHQVAASIMEAAQVLFGISASHIKVLKMEVRQ